MFKYMPSAQRHPEISAGEIFLTNIHETDHDLLLAWKTARLGEHAYNEMGEMLDNTYKSVFVSETEYYHRYGIVPE